jgi:hypothetical protein
VPPRHLRRTIADFEAQTAAMNARLQELAHYGSSTYDGAIDDRGTICQP